MKKNLFYLFAILFMAGAVTACSSDDEEVFKIDAKLVGEWNLAEASPVILSAEAKAGVSEDEYVLNLPIFEEPYNFSDALSTGAFMGGAKLKTMLESISFKENGEVVAKYYDIDAAGNPLGDAKISPEGLMTYSVSVDRPILRLVPNAKNIIAKMKEDGTGNEMIYNLISTYLSGSFFIEYKLSNGDLALEIKADVLPSAKRYFPKVAAMLGDVELSPEMKPMVDALLSDMPGILKNSKFIDAGLNLEKK